ncbi:MAG: histidine kinase [Chitinophagales bacterium]|nr:histidine kinase [Chitinophagales bacterium]
MYNGFCFFKDKSITKTIKDREGSYWFSTLNDGIILVPDLQMKLFSYDNKSITSLASIGKNILTGTSDHRIIEFDVQKEMFNNVYKEYSNHEIIGLLYDDVINETLFWSNRIGFVKDGIKHKEINNFAAKSITPINNHFYAVASATSISLIRRDNTLAEVPKWLQTEKNSWNNYEYNLLERTTRGRYVLYNKEDSTLYAATTNGLFYFSPKGKGKITYKGKDIFASQLTLINSEIYVATYSEGLFRIKKNNVVENIDNKNINSSLYKITASGNYLWMITDETLQRYNIKNQSVVNYTHADGLPKAELKEVLIKNGKVYLATTQGMVVFDEALNIENNVPPVLTINNFLVNGESIKTEKQPLKLNSTQNNIVLHFSLLSFKGGVNSGKIQYKLNNESWQDLETGARQINLPALSSGDYNLLVRAFNEDNISSNKDIQIKFSIASPFYKQWWFIATILFVISIVLWLIFLYRLKNIKQRNKLEEQKIKIEQELNQSMLSSIKSQMNPHFLFNALNTIQSYIYTNDKENASEYLSKFSQLTRLILDMSNKDYASLADEIKALKLYLELEQQRFEDKLNYTFTIDENINAETLYIPTMLIQPYIENAIKHGLLHKKNDWKLAINFQKEKEGILVSIDDNGIGRKRSEQLNKLKPKHKSFALKANEKRLEILNKGLKQTIALQIIDKEDKHGNALGTLVKLFIPTKSKAIM